MFPRLNHLFKNRNFLMSIILLIIITIIFIILATIFYLNSNNNNQSTRDHSVLLGYSNLKNKINTIAGEIPQGINTKAGTTFFRTEKYFNIIEGQDSTLEEKYDALTQISLFLASMYSYTNDQKLYELINEDIDNFAIQNFPNLHEKDKIRTSCQDDSCVDSSQPPQLENILKLIEKSDFPEVVKETLTQDLINTGYKSNKEAEGKVNQYMILADMTEENTWFSPSGQNIIIANDIYDLVKINFPSLFNEYINSISPDISELNFIDETF